MKHLYSLIALSMGLTLAPSAFAQGMSKPDYKTQQQKIDGDYKLDRSACSKMKGQQNDLCIAQAKATQKIAKADLEAAYTPTRRTQYNASVAKAEADYSVARERCNAKTGNAKDVCVKEAQSAETAAKSDATMQLKTSDATAAANEKATAATSEAKTATSEAQVDATVEKRNARYAVEKEKCNAMAGDAKDLCLAQAKTGFGR